MKHRVQQLVATAQAVIGPNWYSEKARQQCLLCYAWFVSNGTQRNGRSVKIDTASVRAFWRLRQLRRCV